MIRLSPAPGVGIALSRAVLCPNDDTVYDAELWTVCPTCENEDRVSLSRVLGNPELIGAGEEKSGPSPPARARVALRLLSRRGPPPA